jgi:hypothetical protein
MPESREDKAMRAICVCVAVLTASCVGLDPAAYGNPSGQLRNKVSQDLFVAEPVDLLYSCVSPVCQNFRRLLRQSTYIFRKISIFCNFHKSLLGTYDLIITKRIFLEQINSIFVKTVLQL